MSKAVTNSTCLIALERIQRLDILFGQFQEVIVPQAVQDEVGSPLRGVSIKPIANRALVAALKTQVGPGEAEAIALAAESPGTELVLDDRKARRLAGELGLHVVGTVGLILRARKSGVLEAVRPVLRRLVETGFRIGAGLHEEALRIAGESQHR